MGDRHAPAARRVLLAVLTGVLVLTGCGVPEAGPAVPVRRIAPGAQPDEPVVREQRTGPQPGGTAEQAVTGFLEASRSSVDRHEQSRSFLTGQADQAWNDEGPVQIVAIESVRETATQPQQSKVQVLGRYGGQVVPGGAFVDRPGGRGDRLDLVLELRQADGVWRLDNPPRGVLLRDVDFAQAYRSIDVYFLARDRDVLVPDPRYIDRSLARVAQPTAVVRALLDGPSDWIAPAVRTALPAGTRLLGNVAANPDEDDLVVDLSPEVENVSQPERRLVAAQLGASLSQYTGVRIQVAGRSLSIDGAPEVQRAEQWQRYDPNAPRAGLEAYYVADGAVSLLDPGDRSGSKRRPTPVAPEATSGVVSAGLSDDLRAVALVRRAPGGRQVLHVGLAGESAGAKVTGVRITRPSWGFGAGDGALVAVDGARLLRVPALGEPVQVTAPGLVRRPVAALRVAPDGVRVAVVAGPPGQETLSVGLLVRPDARNRRVERLVQLRTVGGPLTGVVDAGWSGQSTLFAAAAAASSTEAGAGEGPVTWDVSVDGATRDLGPSAGLPVVPAAVAVAPGEAPLVEAGGKVYRRFTGQWGAPVAGLLPQGSAPFYPG